MKSVFCSHKHHTGRDFLCCIAERLIEKEKKYWGGRVLVRKRKEELAYIKKESGARAERCGL